MHISDVGIGGEETDTTKRHSPQVVAVGIAERSNKAGSSYDRGGCAKAAPLQNNTGYKLRHRKQDQGSQAVDKLDVEVRPEQKQNRQKIEAARMSGRARISD